jgi:hypothetical protein
MCFGLRCVATEGSSERIHYVYLMADVTGPSGLAPEEARHEIEPTRV